MIPSADKIVLKKFRVLTLQTGKTVYVNMEKVRYFYSAAEFGHGTKDETSGTYIHFGDRDVHGHPSKLFVREFYEEVAHESEI